MTPFSSTVPSEALALVNVTGVYSQTVTDGSGIGGSTILVSGWAQLAVCILIVVLCCCCTLLCLCTSCMCCTSQEPSQPHNTTLVTTTIISDKPPSYDEAQRTSRYGLPSYQEAVRRESEVSWIRIPSIPLWPTPTPVEPTDPS